ncbi:MAG: 16S rRNA (cytosine(1402)-N(4))-methyltransferase RsmH, partial [Acidobacteria bacterium]|nr:16S rRNA (cytosine(1402)-N(4))-methyltransferase RsmH [Acidobacteriota bacterium]
MHIPVLLGEAMEWLAIRPEGVYVDATAGAGGHAQRILESLTTGRLLALDRDPLAIEIARENLSAHGHKLTLVQENFAHLPRLLRQIGVTVVDGILADLGLSQIQIDFPERGFSLKGAGPLDMRMDPRDRLTAAEIVNHYGERELAALIYQFGEERRSQR